MILRAVFPWLLGVLAVPVAYATNSAWSLLLMAALVAFGYWLIWPRFP